MTEKKKRRDYRQLQFDGATALEAIEKIRATAIELEEGGASEITLDTECEDSYGCQSGYLTFTFLRDETSEEARVRGLDEIRRRDVQVANVRRDAKRLGLKIEN